MTMIPPTNVGGFSTRPVFPYLIPPYTNGVPFTYRDGMTFLRRMEAFALFIDKSLIPWIDEGFKEYIDAFNTALDDIRKYMEAQQVIIDNKVAEFVELADKEEADFRALAAQLTAAIQALVVNAEAAADRSEAAQAAAEAARDLAEQWAAQTHALQDDAVSTLVLELNSKTQDALNAFTWLDAGGIPETAMSPARQATNKRVDAVFGNGTPDLTGVTVTLFGHSWVASPTGGVEQYLTRAFKALNAKTIDGAKSQSGYRAQDVAISAYSGLSSGTIVKPEMAWPAGRRGVVAVDHLLNNLASDDSDKNRSAALQATRALVALLFARKRVEEDDPSITYTGTWAQRSVTNLWASGGTVSGSQTTYAHADFKLENGRNYLIFEGLDDTASGVTGGPFEVARGETLIGRYTSSNLTLATGAHGSGVTPFVVDAGEQQQNMPDLVSTTKNPGGWFFLDGVLPQLPEGQQPLVFLIKNLPVTNPNYTGKDALYSYLRTVPDTVKAEFGDNVIVLDPLPGWNPATMLLADGLHPSETGAQYLSTFIQTAVKAELAKRNNRVLNRAMGLI